MLHKSILAAAGLALSFGAFADNGHDGQVAAPSASVPITVGDAWFATSQVPPAVFWSGQFADDTFTFSGPGTIYVTDDFLCGDVFRVYDNGVVLGETSSVAADSSCPELGPDAAFADSRYSSGTFNVGAGNHEISIEVIQNPFGSGRGYIQVMPGADMCDIDGDGDYDRDDLVASFSSCVGGGGDFRSCLIDVIMLAVECGRP